MPRVINQKNDSGRSFGPIYLPLIFPMMLAPRLWRSSEIVLELPPEDSPGEECPPVIIPSSFVGMIGPSLFSVGMVKV